MLTITYFPYPYYHPLPCGSKGWYHELERELGWIYERVLREEREGRNDAMIF